METIQEDEELIIEHKPPEPFELEKELELSYSADQEDTHVDRLQRTRAARKKKRLALKKIEKAERIKKKHNEPPKIFCPVKNCKWSGYHDAILQIHIDNCHKPNFDFCKPVTCKKSQKFNKSYDQFKKYRKFVDKGDMYPNTANYKEWEVTLENFIYERAVDQLGKKMEEL